MLATVKEKRGVQSAIPDDVYKYLNEAQREELKNIEKFGWGLKFVRRPLFQDPLVVVMHPDGKAVGVLEPDGTLNLEPDLVLRS